MPRMLFRDDPTIGNRVMSSISFLSSGFRSAHSSKAVHPIISPAPSHSAALSSGLFRWVVKALK